MKVVHIESGLGNQMLSYCEYLALKKLHPDEDIYIETIVYDIPECNEFINQWNGYELERIFGINAPNVKSLFTDEQWAKIITEIRESRFWVLVEHNWNYPVYFTKAFNHAGLHLKNMRGDFEEKAKIRSDQPDLRSLKYRLRHTLLYYHFQMWKMRQPRPMETLDCRNELFLETEEDIFTGQKLMFKKKGSGIELIEDDVRKAFTFPEIIDKKNKNTFEYISNCNSVAIHARRGDMLGANAAYYLTGYFKRAVRYIRKYADNPKFFIFCDPDSVSWAHENANILGLDMKKDEIHFVNWNKSEDSFRDMQLMAACKHQVITNSSFGWWGAWLNTNPNKITTTADFKMNTTHTF